MDTLFPCTVLLHIQAVRPTPWLLRAACPRPMIQGMRRSIIIHQALGTCHRRAMATKRPTATPTQAEPEKCTPGSMPDSPCPVSWKIQEIRGSAGTIPCPVFKALLMAYRLEDRTLLRMNRCQGSIMRGHHHRPPILMAPDVDRETLVIHFFLARTS